jgi:hypothetical protein
MRLLDCIGGWAIYRVNVRTTAQIAYAALMQIKALSVRAALTNNEK